MKTLAKTLLLLAFPMLLSAQDKALHPLSFHVNSGYNESWPTVSPDGHALYFSRQGHPHNIGASDEYDIWASYCNPDGHWAKAINLGAPANSSDEEAVVGISGSGRRLFLFQPATGTLSFTERNGRAWTPRQPLLTENIGIDSSLAFVHIHLDGHTMLLSMAGPQSLGQHDLYVSFADDAGRWGPARHLGPALNSTASESGLFLAADGKTLYFSSARPGGQGGQDLYHTRRLDDSWQNWSPPINLGPEINSPEDDIFISMPASGKAIYLARPSTDGQTDLFETSLPEALRPEPVTMLIGQVREATSGKSLSVPVRAIGPDSLYREEWPDRQGSFQLVIPSVQPIHLTAEAPGYYSIVQPDGPAALAAESLDYEHPALLASVSNDIEYVRRNAEIEQLQLHIRALDDELIQLRQEHEAYRRAQLAQPNTPLNREQFSDPEIDALRHRYEQYKRSRQDTVPPPVPESYDSPAAPKEELESLRARYQRYQEYQAAQQKKEQAQATESEMLWETSRGFEDFQEEVETGLANTLIPAVRQDLSNQMMEEAMQEVAQSLSSRERRQMEMKAEAVRQEIRNSFNAPGQASGQWASKGAQAETEWERKLRADLKSAIEPEVRARLEESLREDIRKALRTDLTYWAKKEAQAELQAELEQKLQLQIEIERRRPVPPPGNVDAVTPLAPAPAGYQELEQDLLMVPAKVGQIIPLRGIAFEPNKTKLQPGASAEVERAASFLKQNPGLVVEVAAHTGGQLSHSNALGISIQRARVIADLLIKAGIEEQRITYKGYGKALPVADNSTPEGQRMNQRIELRIIAQQPITNNQ